MREENQGKPIIFTALLNNFNELKDLATHVPEGTLTHAVGISAKAKLSDQNLAEKVAVNITRALMGGMKGIDSVLLQDPELLKAAGFIECDATVDANGNPIVIVTTDKAVLTTPDMLRQQAKTFERLAVKMELAINAVNKMRPHQ